MSCYCLSTTMDEEMQRAVADLSAITGREEIENNTRYQVSCERDGPAFTPRLPGRRQLHGVLSHSSTRPSDLHGHRLRRHSNAARRWVMLRRGFLPFRLFENAFEVNGDYLQSFHKPSDLKEIRNDFPQGFVLHGKLRGLHTNIHASRVSKQ